MHLRYFGKGLSERFVSHFNRRKAVPSISILVPVHVERRQRIVISYSFGRLCAYGLRRYLNCYYIMIYDDIMAAPLLLKFPLFVPMGMRQDLLKLSVEAQQRPDILCAKGYPGGYRL